MALAPDAGRHWLEMSQRKATASAIGAACAILRKRHGEETDDQAKKHAKAKLLALKTEIEQREAKMGLEVSILMPLAGYV